MFRLRWPAIAGYSVLLILGAFFVFHGTLSAKDSSQTSANKVAKKKKTTRRPSKNSSDSTPSVDGSGGTVSGTSVGGGGIVGGGSGNLSGAASQGGTAAPPGVRSAPAATGSTTSQARKRTTSGGKANSSKPAPLTADHPLVRKVVEIQNRNQDTLLSQKGIAGVATGLDDDGNVVIRVYTTGADSPAIPTQIEGVAVMEVLTGPIRFAQQLTKKLPTPCPIGVSAFADTSTQVNIPCQGSTGTIACRMRDQFKNVYALSCNHVFAGNQLFVRTWASTGAVTIPPNIAFAPSDLQVNFLPIGTQALQPAGSDVGCQIPVNKFSNILGTLATAVPFFAQYPDPCTGAPVLPLQVTNSPNPNTVDAALVQSSTGALDTATPTDGYGIPTNNYHQASLGLAVQKYGRSTRLTKGTVTGLNATYNISIDITNFKVNIETDCIGVVGINGNVFSRIVGLAGTITVRFTQQIEVSPTGTSGVFVQDGDSGALVVDMTNNPVAMVQSTAGSPIALCGDFNQVVKQLVKYLSMTTGLQMALSVDTSPSVLQQSFDGKVGRGAPNTP